MKKIKSILAIILALAMMFTLAACGGDKPAETPAADAPAADAPADKPAETPAADDFSSKEFTIGLSQEGLDHPFMVKQREAIMKAAEEYPNIKVIATDGQNSVEKQVAGIEDMLAQGIDLLIVQASKAEGLKQELDKVDSEGIPFIFAGKPILGTAATTIVSNDNRLIGEDAGKYFVEQLKAKYGTEKGNVAIIHGIAGDQTAEDRVGGFKSVIEQYPDIKVIAELYGEYRRPQAYTATTDILTSFPEKGSIDIIYGCNGDSGIAAAQAVKDAGRGDEGIMISSIDGTQEELDLIKDGQIKASWLYSHCGEDAFGYAVQILKGEEVPENIPVPSLLVTIDNVEGQAPAF